MINLEDNVSSITVCGKNVWIGDESGLISIFESDGTLSQTIKADKEPITHLVGGGDYIWSASLSFVKIWKLQRQKFNKYQISCHLILDTTFCKPPLVISKDETTVFSLIDEGENELLMQWSISGEPISALSHSHSPDSRIETLAFSVSPDRLWSASNNGSINWYELKRGKKTMRRLEKSAFEEQEDKDVSELGVIAGEDEDVKTMRKEITENSSSDEDFGGFDLTEFQDELIEVQSMPASSRVSTTILAPPKEVNHAPPPIEPHPLSPLSPRLNEGTTSPPPIEPHPLNSVYNEDDRHYIEPPLSPKFQNTSPPPVENHPYDNTSMDTDLEDDVLIVGDTNTAPPPIEIHPLDKESIIEKKESPPKQKFVWKCAEPVARQTLQDDDGDDDAFDEILAKDDGTSYDG